MLTIFIYCPIQVETVLYMFLVFIWIDHIIDVHIHKPAVIGIAKQLRTMILDIARIGKIDTPHNHIARNGQRVVITRETCISRIETMFMKLIGNQASFVSVIHYPRHSVTAVVLRVIVGHSDIVLGGAQVVIRARQLIPLAIVRYSVAVLVLHHLHGSWFCPYTVSTTRKRVTFYQ